jgi:hypothetical protein
MIKNIENNQPVDIAIIITVDGIEVKRTALAVSSEDTALMLNNMTFAAKAEMNGIIDHLRTGVIERPGSYKGAFQ